MNVFPIKSSQKKELLFEESIYSPQRRKKTWLMRIFDVRMNVCWDVELHAGLNPAADALLSARL